MVYQWIVTLLLAVAVNVVAYLIMPKPKVAKPEASQDLDSPTSEEGQPIPVVFGTVTIKGLQVLDFFDKSKTDREVDV
jgi:hypothetical protein